VGNIPYDATEEQLIEVFREVGPVASFRFVSLALDFDPPLRTLLLFPASLSAAICRIYILL